jgi:hypothetical protein
VLGSFFKIIALTQVWYPRYGDITPLSVPGKFLVMIMIVISLAFVGLPAHPPPLHRIRDQSHTPLLLAY